MATRGGWRTTGAVLIGAAIVLFAVWALRGSQQPPASPVRRAPPDEPDVAASGIRHRPELREDTPSGQRPRPTLGDGTSAAAAPPTVPMAAELRQVPAKLKQAAKPCFNPKKHARYAAERVSFHYTVEYRNGVGRLTEVAPVDTNLADEDLQNCILDRVEKVVWNAAGAPDRTSRRQQLSISIHDLSR